MAYSHFRRPYAEMGAATFLISRYLAILSLNYENYIFGQARKFFWPLAASSQGNVGPNEVKCVIPTHGQTTLTSLLDV